MDSVCVNTTFKYATFIRHDTPSSIPQVVKLRLAGFRSGDKPRHNLFHTCNGKRVESVLAVDHVCDCVTKKKEFFCGGLGEKLYAGAVYR